jgi:hypothetical protein
MTMTDSNVPTADLEHDAIASITARLAALGTVIKSRPLASVAIAAAIGYLAARLTRVLR